MRYLMAVVKTPFALAVKSPPFWWASLSLMSSLLFEFQYHNDITHGYFINVYTDQFSSIDRLRRSKHRVDTVFILLSTAY